MFRALIPGMFMISMGGNNIGGLQTFIPLKLGHIILILYNGHLSYMHQTTCFDSRLSCRSIILCFDMEFDPMMIATTMMMMGDVDREINH